MSRRLVPAQPRSKKDIEFIALEIIRTFQPSVLTNDEPFDVVRFFECYMEDRTGVKYDYRELQNGIYGYTDTEKMECVISTNLVENSLQEKFCRSTMAHEVGHVIMHVKDYRHKRALLKFIHEKGHQLRAYREDKIITYKNPEWQAWSFASAILMPSSVFTLAANDGYGIRDLSERFNVNPAFVRSRLKALNLKI